MAELNIRKVDVALITMLKREALMLGLSLREHCIARLSGCEETVEQWERRINPGVAASKPIPIASGSSATRQHQRMYH